MNDFNKSIETKKGVLKYRLPDISEGYEFLALIDTIKTNADVFIVKSRIIKNMGNMVDLASVGYLTYSEMLNDKENMIGPISDISKEIFDDILELLGKKI